MDQFAEKGVSHEATARIFAFALCAVLVALCALAEAQQPNKVPLVGFLIAPTRSFFSPRVGGLREGLRKLGYVEGKTIVIETDTQKGS